MYENLLFNSSNYRKIGRPINKILWIIPIGYHIGVYNIQKGIVYDITKNPQNEGLCLYREINLKFFLIDEEEPTYLKTTNPVLPNSEIKARLDVMSFLFKNMKLKISYDPTGKNGWNCESFQEFVMTGKDITEQGIMLSKWNDWKSDFESRS